MTLTQILWFLLLLQILGLFPLVSRYAWARFTKLPIDTVWVFLGKFRRTHLFENRVVLSLGWIPVGLGISLMSVHEKSVLRPEVVGFRVLVARAIFIFLVIPSLLLFAAISLGISFYVHGENSRTLQVTNLQGESSLAARLGIERGDILVAIDHNPIQHFETGLQTLRHWAGPSSKVLHFERKEGWLVFSTVESFRKYLASQFKAGQYIRISNSKDSALFYAVPEALKHVDSVKQDGLELAVSTTQKLIEILWEKEQGDTLGIGVKPYSIPGSHQSYGVFQSMVLGAQYTYHLTRIMLIAIIDLTLSLPTGIGWESLTQMISDLQQFVAEVSSMEILSLSRSMAIFSIFFAIFNLLPLPGLAMWSIIRLGMDWSGRIPDGISSDTRATES